MSKLSFSALSYNAVKYPCSIQSSLSIFKQYFPLAIFNATFLALLEPPFFLSTIMKVELQVKKAWENKKFL